MQGVWVWSLVGELKSHRPQGQRTKTKQKQYCNKFNKDLKKKWSTSKNLKEKKNVLPTPNLYLCMRKPTHTTMLNITLNSRSQTLYEPLLMHDTHTITSPVHPWLPPSPRQLIHTTISPQISSLFPSPYSQLLASYFTEETEASEEMFLRLPASVFALSLLSTQQPE